MKNPTWGDTVRVHSEAVSPERQRSLAEIVGIREIEDSAQADQFSAPIGSKVYLIEFGDGEAVEVPEGGITVVPC